MYGKTYYINNIFMYVETYLALLKTSCKTLTAFSCKHSVNHVTHPFISYKACWKHVLVKYCETSL